MPPISLPDLLASRDARRRHQEELLRQHAGQTLVCLTVIMPGAEKRSPLSLTIARAAVEALRRIFPAAAVEQRDLPTGFEAYLLTPLPPLEAKRLTAQLEDTHPLGRLFDADVLAPLGSPLGEAPISRAAIGHPARRCLL